MSDSETERRRYSLLGKNIIPHLEDRNFFENCIIHNYILTASRVGLFPEMSTRRVIEAYAHWKADIRRTLNAGIDQPTLDLDHFKHASFIAFWLRRTMPINKVTVLSPRGSDSTEDRHQRRNRYFMYGNELSAFLIGYKICINYELGSLLAADNDNVLDISLIPAVVSRFDLPDDLLQNYLMIWKHKNMSPYSVYLMYKSLFNRTGGSALGLFESMKS